MPSPRHTLLVTWCLVTTAATQDLDGSTLVQRSLRASTAQAPELVRRAEQVLEVVGPLETHKRPTVADKEQLMMALALFKNPALIRLHQKRRRMPATTSMVPAAEHIDGARASIAAAGASAASEQHLATRSKRSNASTAALSRTSATEPKGPAAALANGAPVPVVAARAAAASRAPPATAPSKHSNASAAAPSRTSKIAARKVKVGSCSAEDIKLMRMMGGGYLKGSLPEASAACGKKAYKLGSGISIEGFNDCFLPRTGLSEPCSGCFVRAAGYGAKNCAMKCMLSWCSKSCLDCAEEYRSTELLRCVGSAPPNAEAC